MEVEDLGVGVVSLDSSPDKGRESFLDGPAEMKLSGYPEYPKELVFLPMFSDPENLGGEWDPVNDELINLTTEPQEIKYAAANMRFLAALEEIPLEQFAPVADLYQEAYNRSIYGGKADTAKKLYTAVGESIQQKKKEEDELDEQIIEKEWKDEHPYLAIALRAVNALSGAALDLVGGRPDNDAPLTNAETYEHYRRSLDRLAGLNYQSFNPAGAVVQETGPHRLGLNLDGIAGLVVGWGSGRALSGLSGETRAFRIRRGIDERVSLANAKINQATGIKYDPETRRFYDGDGQVANELIPERIRNGAFARGIAGTSKPFIVPKNIEASAQNPSLPQVEDRRVDYYDDVNDLYYDRGKVILGENIDSYLEAREKASLPALDADLAANSARRDLANVLLLRARQLELGVDPVRRFINAEALGGSRIEQALGRSISRSSDPAADFVDKRLGAISLKGPIPRRGSVEGLARSAIKDANFNTATKTLFIDTEGLSPAEVEALKAAIQAGTRNSTKSIFYLQ